MEESLVPHGMDARVDVPGYPDEGTQRAAIHGEAIQLLAEPGQRVPLAIHREEIRQQGVRPLDPDVQLRRLLDVRTHL